jgi:hypothetical protein
VCRPPFFRKEQDSSFSEEKDAKRLLFLAPAERSRPIPEALGPRTWEWQRIKSLLVLFFRKEHAYFL